MGNDDQDGTETFMLSQAKANIASRCAPEKPRARTGPAVGDDSGTMPNGKPLESARSTRQPKTNSPRRPLETREQGPFARHFGEVFFDLRTMYRKDTT
jgi:hypothetical protein